MRIYKIFRSPLAYMVLSFVMLVFNTGCKKDWLDVKADKTQAVPSTVKEMQAIMDDLSSINGYAWMPLVLGEVAADDHTYSENVYESMGVNYVFLQNAYTWTVQGGFDASMSYQYYYTVPYTAVSLCNVVLEVKQGDNNKTDFDQVRAQALFVRASLYHALAQIYAPPYKVSTAATDLGLALRLNINITETSKRSSLEETYQQIIDDLKMAAAHLPVTAAFQTRANKPAALGMLARTYLTMGDFENAFHYANEYLKIKNELIDYSLLPAAADFIGVNKEVSFLSFVPTYATEGIGINYLVDEDLYASYDEDDLRKTVFFKPSAAGYVFKGAYTGRMEDVFYGLATDEIYLIRAECYARQGKTDLAMKDLNDLLRTRWAKNPDGSTKYTDQTAADGIAALKKILAERKKQLLARGIRWSDLRRLNLEPALAQTLQRTVAGKQYTLTPNSSRYTFPFPQAVIDISGMQQNQAW